MAARQAVVPQWDCVHGYPMVHLVAHLFEEAEMLHCDAVEVQKWRRLEDVRVGVGRRLWYHRSRERDHLRVAWPLRKKQRKFVSSC